jgi:hypothetical protein
MIDKRSSSGNKLKYGELDPDPDNTARGNTRLSQVRWPLGEEPYPDVEGTDPDDPTVNVKLEVVEHPDTGPSATCWAVGRSWRCHALFATLRCTQPPRWGPRKS